MISFLNKEMESLVQFLSPFLVMPFLSTGFPHLPKLMNLSASLLPSSFDLGRDCLVWKRIRLLNGAKHQLRAPLAFIPSYAWLFHHHGLSGSIPAPDSVWTWSVLPMFYFCVCKTVIMLSFMFLIWIGGRCWTRWNYSEIIREILTWPEIHGLDKKQSLRTKFFSFKKPSLCF